MHACTVALVQDLTPMAWIGPGERKKGPLPVKSGDFLELQVYDDADLEQGRILVGVIDILGKYKNGTVISAMYLGSSDAYYHWWMMEGDGSPDPDGGAYHLCGVKNTACPPTDKFGEMVHSDKVRNVPRAHLEPSKVTWLKDRIVRAGVDARIARFEGLRVAQAKPPPSGLPGHGGVTWAGQPGASEEPSEEESSSSYEEASSSGGGSMKKRIQELRDELEKAEKEMTGGKAKKKAKKKRKQERKEREVKEAKAKKKEAKEGEKKKTKVAKEAKKTKTGKEGKKREASPVQVTASEESEKPKKKKRKRKKDEEPEKTKKKRKREEESEDEEESSEEKPLFAAAKKEVEKTTSKKGDRGPFGGGSAVSFGNEESEEESDQDFRKAPSISAKSGQLKLLNYAHQFPGRLASRLLSQVTARGMGGANPEVSHLTPVVGLHYVLTILLPSLGAKAGMRTGRELKTLATILDHLAAQEPAKAADVTAQRIKALERATAEGHWGAAQFLELLPPEGTMLLDRAEENYVAKEYLQDMKLKGYDKPFRNNQDKGKGKGKEPKGKGKGKKQDGDDKKADK